MDRNLLLVLGMHRSGTSALANGLSNLGFYTGENLLPANSANEKGYWENADIVDIHRDFLEGQGLHWAHVKNYDPRIFYGEKAESARARLVAILNELFETSGDLLVKDPRLCRLMPLWEPVFRHFGLDPEIVLMIRHPLEVSASLLKRNELPRSVGCYLWYLYLRDSLESLKPGRHSIVFYDDLLSSPREEFGRVARQIGCDDDRIARAGIEQVFDTGLRTWKTEDLYHDEDYGDLKCYDEMYKSIKKFSDSNIQGYDVLRKIVSAEVLAQDALNEIYFDCFRPCKDNLDHLNVRIEELLQKIKKLNQIGRKLEGATKNRVVDLILKLPLHHIQTLRKEIPKLDSE